MIFFVGDKPSDKNLNPDVAFVGTKSYKRLLEWMYHLDADVTDTVLCNKHQINDRLEVITAHLHTSIEPGDKVVALGKNAAKRLSELKIEHFEMPHPSGANRKLNDKKYVRDVLRRCKIYLDL